MRRRPNDAVLLTSDVRTDRRVNRSICASGCGACATSARDCGVPLIFDEVYTGFRLAPGGAQEYFGVDADLVVYGKTVAGGLPIGVVCGRSNLMRRIDPDRPMRMAYIVGTFSAHPLGDGRDERVPALGDRARERRALPGREPAVHGLGAGDQRTVRRGSRCPVRVVNLGTVWTVLFKEPSRFNWLLQYYLRAEDVTLSWVGTGRCLVSMDFTDADYRALQQRLIAAATPDECAMDGG